MDLKDMKTHYQTIEIQVPIERPRAGALHKCGQFRLGQRDRNAGKPCASANGAYLDGWYNPTEQVPPWITRAQMEAFNI